MKKTIPLAMAVLALGGALLMHHHSALGQQGAPAAAAGANDEKPAVNIAVFATPTTSMVSGDQTVTALNDGFTPRSSRDTSHGAYGNWPSNGTNWVQYEWTKPISTNKTDVYWFADGAGIKFPGASRVLYWDGTKFQPVAKADGMGVEGNKFNETTFDEVTTTKIRLEFDSPAQGANNSTGILEWRVFDSGKSPKFPPTVRAGVDRVVVVGAKTYLNGVARSVSDDSGNIAWTKTDGPGSVAFEDAKNPVTTATFSAPGNYTLALTSRLDDLSSSSSLRVRVEQPAPATHLEPVFTGPYKVDSPLWNSRVKALIVNWIPHCVDYLEHPEKHMNARGQVQGPGGIDNFIEAGKKLAGQSAAKHIGYPFANAYVHNTVESMCIALQVDPQGDAEIAAAQAGMRETLSKWVPIILAAQEPDGYLQTRFTLGTTGDRNGAPGHWDPIRGRGEHEGYTAGYFIESAIAHYQLTKGTDKRMYDAAIKLADCWCNNIGPAPKKTWYDGHEEMEQALIRLAHLVNQVEGQGKGQKYSELAKFLIDCRNLGTGGRGGSPYDQSHLPAIQQYEAVGHAVRAVYLYTGMSGVAMDTGDLQYQSAVASIWDNLVNRKYYVTGGVGSGETSEGFGPDYSLRNAAYCESCSGCGELFFQHNMNLAYHDAKYADLVEETLYNAILGDIDLDGKNFTYTNALDGQTRRYLWHDCPCCIGNIPRTLLNLPAWMYATDASSLYVNMYLGSSVDVGKVAGSEVQIVQKTDYPWKPDVSMTVNPASPHAFTLRIRVPNRQTSELYPSTPEVSGMTGLKVNGTPVTATADHGYVAITRNWNPGDKVDFSVPMQVQRVTSSDKVAADRGHVALRYGPLIYNVEATDHNNMDGVLAANSPLTTEFQPELLDGVVVIKGQYSDGSPLFAVPNYVRNNRGGRSMIWIKDQ